MNMVDQKIKARAMHRLKIIAGQLAALTKAIEKEEYCTGLLNQSFSIQQSLKSLDALLLENHLKTHVRHKMAKKDELDAVIQELVGVYTLSNK